MKRIVAWLLGTVSAVVLMFGYHTSTSGPDAAVAPISSGSVGSTPAPAPSTASGSGSGDDGTDDGSTSTPTPATTPVATPSSASSTVTGDVAQTQWGPVQVQLTVQSGKITAVNVLQYPNGNHRDVEINDYALPVLIDETVKAQNAQIDMVSGATVTSDGYVRSLQSALDQVK
ncbi:FMN-binding protein [Kribbella sp. VKM Ac-2571]|uniref:FMN-binding protein n=1 Tax=Kribbella sp. VKM Ac-2571 TaxID=2512222 RepID=UPI00105BAAFA|nr:FMN-binding protein [Kribbella sp. VKM Ac-2571]